MELPTMSGTFPFVGLVAIFLSIQVLVCTCKNSPECNKPFNCGTITIQDISYPFRQRGSPEYCGQPRFELFCLDGHLPSISIDSKSYKVLEYNTTLKFLTLAPQETSGFSNVICPERLVNTSLNLSPFHSTWDTNNISLYYDCPANANQYQGLKNHQFNCTSFGDYTEYTVVGYFVVTSSFSKLSVAAKDALRSCHSYVLLPAFSSMLQVLEHSPSLANLAVTLANGFRVQWSENVSSLPDNPKTNMAKEKLKGSFNFKSKVIIGVTGSAASITGLICVLYLVVIFRKKRGTSSTENSRTHKENIDAFIKKHGSRASHRYSYNEIKKMTNNFLEKLGQGGYGSVYKGKLPDGSFVAVKLLSESKGSGEEFLNEVASFSRTSHINIVTLLGFCYEKSKRALVYEFMPNGSLDRFIYRQGDDKIRQLDWKTLYDIALGIARGLEYLHRGCTTRILHFDIKPHNILLDDKFCPKISDFGLSKLCKRNESMVSLIGARGTAGYIAPEVFSRNFGEVSHKSDVYSYGMMLLEMVGGRRNIDVNVSETSEIYFPSWIHKHLDDTMNLIPDGIMVEEEDVITKKLTVVSLRCIQSVPTVRPSMTKVVEMLQGDIQSLEIPPNLSA